MASVYSPALRDTSHPITAASNDAVTFCFERSLRERSMEAHVHRQSAPYISTAASQSLFQADNDPGVNLPRSAVASVAFLHRPVSAGVR